jgi:dynactin complex subunit
MFKQGNLVRRITEDGSGEIVSVVCVEDNGVMQIKSVHQSEDRIDMVDETDYELVTDNIAELDKVKTESHKLSRTQEELHEDICKLFAQVIQFMEPELDGDRIALSINAEYYTGNAVEVGFKVCIRYGEDVVTDNLFTSAQVAVNRYTQNKGLKPKRIAMNALSVV